MSSAKAVSKAQVRKPESDTESEVKALMLSSLQGDGKAYEAFLTKVAGMLRAQFMKSLRSSRTGGSQAEDLVQEVLIAIHQKRHTYRPDLPILPWIFSIARYRLIDSVRAQGRQPAFAEWNDEIDVAAADSSDSSAKEDRAELEELMNELPERQRTVLRLAKIEEMPLAEVGLKMNMSLAAVKVMVHRAVALLKKAQSRKAGAKDENE